MALLEAARNSAAKPALAIVSLVFGSGATLAMNVAAGWHHGSAGALVAALPPLALVLSLETLMGLVRRSRERSVPPDPGQAGPEPGHCPHQVAMTADDAVISAYLHARDCVGDTPSQRQLAAQFGVSRARVAALVSPLNGTPDLDSSQPGAVPPEGPDRRADEVSCITGDVRLPHLPHSSQTAGRRD